MSSMSKDHIDWNEYLAELAKLVDQQYGQWNKLEEEPKKIASPKRPQHVKDWSQSQEQEILAQLPKATGAVVKDFYIRISERGTGNYTFNVYQVINKLHQHVKIDSDIRFKDQVWAEYFKKGAKGFSVEVAVEIVLFLQDIQELLLFI